MRKFIFAFTFLYSLSFFAQRYSLQVKPDDKITMHGFCYWQEMFVKSKDTSFMVFLHRNNPDVIPNLKAGKYVLTARSLFNHRVIKKVTVTKKTPLLKFQGLQTYYKRTAGETNLTEKLKLNDTLYILYNTSADEVEKEKLAITKTKDGYKAILYNRVSFIVAQEMLFKNELYAQVLKFEKEGKQMNSPKAETAPRAEIYSIVLNKEVLSFIIPDSWDGMGRLKRVLFNPENK